jgi:IS5 family transposase
MIKKIRNRQASMFETHVEDLVRADHPYRKLLSIIDFKKMCKPLQGLLNEKKGCPGYNIESGFAGLLLQWMENLSDRELERFFQENNAGKYFCGFSLLEKTPDHSYFSVLRKKIGPERLAEIFNLIVTKLKENRLASNAFTFVDASKIISKVALWEERDRAIEKGIERFNNEVIKKFASDKQARFGCKGKAKFWFGYKRHVAVCMKKGFITKVAITPANVTDAKGLKHICPKESLIYADKGYNGKFAQNVIQKNNCISKVILKNNMKEKDFERDAKISKLRMPYESVFSKMDKRSRYRGIAKNQFQGFMQAIAHNCKKLIRINPPPIFT